MGGLELGAFVSLLNSALVAAFTCLLALGAATVGVVSGAIKGQTTETGLLRGAGVGALTGAITAVQVMDLMVDVEPFSKVGILRSLVNGKVFMEWVSPAVLKAYQWQISAMETSFRMISDIYEIDLTKGLPQDSINKLPHCTIIQEGKEISGPPNCPICLQDFCCGDSVRTLPGCGHLFHSKCIDKWLIRHASCPICRRDV